MLTTQEETVREAAGAGERVVVFVPGMLDNTAGFARQVYEQAAAEQRPVVYLMLDGDEGNHAAAARQLATLTALTRGGSVHASALQVNARDAAEALRQHALPGDHVLWPEAGMLAPARLERELGITQGVLPGGCEARAFPATSLFNAALFWLAGLAILVGFSYLEFAAGGLMSGAPLKAALIILFGLEAGAIYQWNRRFQ